MPATTLRPFEFSDYLTDYLVERGVVDEGQLLDAQAEAWGRGEPLGEAVVARGFLAPEEMKRLAAEYENLRVVYV